MGHPLNESAWRRGWQDTKTAWKSLPFILLDAVGCVVVASIFGVYWGLGLFVFAMLCAWVGATASAPVKQRNEARRLILTRRKVPLPNRESLIRAISAIGDKAIDLKMKQDNLNLKNRSRENPREELAKRDNAWFDYLDAKQALETERLVAGDSFRAIIDNLMMFIDYHINDSMEFVTAEDKPETLKTVPFMTQLENNIEQAIRDLDALNPQEPDKEGSQSE